MKGRFRFAKLIVCEKMGSGVVASLFGDHLNETHQICARIIREDLRVEARLRGPLLMLRIDYIRKQQLLSHDELTV